MNFTKKTVYFFILFFLLLQITNCGSNSSIGEKTQSGSTPPPATHTKQLKVKVEISNLPTEAIKVETQTVFENYPVGQVPPGNNEITDLSQAKNFTLTLAEGVKGKFQIIVKAINKEGCAIGIGTNAITQLETLSSQSDSYILVVDLVSQPCSTCGNGKLDLGEDCEVEQVQPWLASCTNAVLVKKKQYIPSEGVVKCNSDCSLNVNQCTPLCGNGKLDLGEECDAGVPSKTFRCNNHCETQCEPDEVAGLFPGNGTGKADGAGHCYLDVHHLVDSSNRQERKVAYSTADRMCQNFGGHLLVLNSQEEYNYVIENVIKEKTDEKRWIGLRRSFDSSDTNWFENFYWISYSWGIDTKQTLDKDLAWKGKQGRAPEAVISQYDFLQSLWNDGEPSYCSNWFCTSTEPAVEILSKNDGYKLNDNTEDSENYFICEIEPAVRYAP